MTTARVSTSSLNQGPSKKRSVLAGNLPILPGGYESIATVTTSGTSTISFGSIPNTYKHLQLRGIARGTQSGEWNNMTLRVGASSADSGSNYAYHRLIGNGASATADAADTQTSGLFGLTGSGATSNNFMVSVVDILDYANTNKYKTIRSLDGYDNNGSGIIHFQSFLWQSTSAIGIIELTLGGGQTIVSGSHFALYGIR